MPKIRSHSGAKKRFRVTKKGKVKYKKMGLRHLLTGMPSKRGRKLRRSAILAPVEAKIVKRFIPYA